MRAGGSKNKVNKSNKRHQFRNVEKIVEYLRATLPFPKRLFKTSVENKL